MIQIRRANLSDASAIAGVHAASWQETYPGIVPDDFLKNLSVERRFVQWTTRCPILMMNTIGLLSLSWTIKL